MNSYLWSRATKSSMIRGLPISISIEPTTACNLRCPECPSGLRSFTRPTGHLTLERYQNILKQISHKTTYLTLYFQGEPFLNREFLKMISIASQLRMYTATSTNAHFLTDETARETVKSGLNRLIISIDGTDQETYAAYRVGGSLEKVMEGTRKIVYWKKKLGMRTPAIIWQFLVVRPNEHQIGEVLELGRAVGVDKVALKTVQVYDYAMGNPLIPTDTKYSRYRVNAYGTFEIKNKLLDHCWKMWSSCVITWDGRVVPCCFDKDAQHQLGDVSSDSFQSIWKSPAYDQFRSTLMRSRSEIEMCKNCSEGTKIWA